MPETNNVGEIHIMIRPVADGEKDDIEISTSYTVLQLNWVLDKLKKMIIDDELTLGQE